MGLRKANVKLTPSGRTTSIFSTDGKIWYTQDGQPVQTWHEDNVGVDLVAVLFAMIIGGLIWFVTWVLQ